MTTQRLPVAEVPLPQRTVEPAPASDQLAHHPLAFARPGSFLCTEIDDSKVSPARMNSLGICIGRPLELVSAGDPMIVRVCGTAVGLSKQLAANVLVSEHPTPVTA